MLRFRRLATIVTASVGAALLTFGLAAPAQASTPTATRGAIEVANPGWGRIHVQGWAFDPRATVRSSSLDVVIDGRMAGLPFADRSRSDVNQVFRIAGNHGFYLYLPASVGTHRVCVVARPVAGSGSTWSILGCRTLTVSHT